MKLTLAKYSLITLVSGFLIAGAGCTQATPVEKVQPTAKKTVVATTPSPTTLFTVGGLRFHTVPGVSFEKTVKNTAYLIPDEQNSAHDLRLAITVTPSTLKNFETELRDAHEKFTLKNGQGFRQSGVGGGSIYLIKIGQKAYAIMPELRGTPVPGADVPGGGLETTFDVVDLLKTIEAPTTQTITHTKPEINLVTTGYTTTYDIGELKTLISPDGKNIIAPLNLKNLIKKNGSLSSYVLPIHPDNKNIIYLSISNTTSTGKTPTSYLVTNKIFSYNLGTGASKLLYEEQGKKLELHTVGIDGTRLIVLASVVDNSPGPCTDIWYDYTKDFSYLELQENLQGLYPYEVPAEKIAQGEASQKKCLREMEQGANQ